MMLIIGRRVVGRLKVEHLLLLLLFIEQLLFWLLLLLERGGVVDGRRLGVHFRGGVFVVVDLVHFELLGVDFEELGGWGRLLGHR